MLKVLFTVVNRRGFFFFFVITVNVLFRFIVGFRLFKLLVWIFWLMHFTVVVWVLTVCHLVRPLSLAQRKINLQLERPDFNSYMQLVYFDNLQQCFHRLPQLRTKRVQGHNNIYLCAHLDTCQDT